MHDVFFVQKQFQKQRSCIWFCQQNVFKWTVFVLWNDNDSIPDIHKLQPYDLEPEIASSDVSTTTSDENTSSSDSEIADYSRIGNTSWCSCGKCFPMTTYTESLCCRDTNEVADEYFEGNHNYKHPACWITPCASFMSKKQHHDIK